MKEFIVTLRITTLSKVAKSPQSKLKARRETSPLLSPTISVTLRYLTTNKNFNFESFGKNFRTKAIAFEQLTEFLRRLTAKTLLQISPLSKTDDCGFETLAFAQIKFKPDGITLGKDTKIHIFRFGSNGTGGDYRLLGFFETGQAILNIIGFDFNYSAYEH